jgi:hypothetical protein
MTERPRLVCGLVGNKLACDCSAYNVVLWIFYRLYCIHFDSRDGTIFVFDCCDEGRDDVHVLDVRELMD